MSILLSIHQLSKSFATRDLFSGLTFAIESGERIGLIGPNGAGKTTLLKIIAGIESSDGGLVSKQQGLRLAYLQQVPMLAPDKTIQECLLEGAARPEEIENQQYSQELMSRLGLVDENGLGAETIVRNLSGGQKKRVALARELMKRPDLFLLDEPTNHLDVESILWLEELLQSSRFATLVITHDRLFLQRVSNRIIEMDRRHPDGVFSVSGDYLKFLQLKEERLLSQERTEIKLRNTLRRETEWLRSGVKARTTKQEARIKRAEQLKNEVSNLESRNKKVDIKIDFQSAEKNPKRLIDAKGIFKKYGERTIVPSLDLLITPKTRLGLLGPNGCGKSTLLKLLIKEIEADRGSVLHAESLSVAWFEQNRESLNPNINAMQTLIPDGDHVHFRGAKVHVRSYLSRFHFSSMQMEAPVSRLSGGEQARLLIAKLMLTEANVLVLDEPTNDLDIQTLDVLQEVLEDFPGAIILVSHDRYFLDQLAKQILYFDKDGANSRLEFFTGLSQWEDWLEEKRFKKAPALITGTKDGGAKENKKKKLSFKEQKELESMEETILTAESRLEKLNQEILSPENASNSFRLSELTKELGVLEKEIERLYARWSELSS